MPEFIQPQAFETGQIVGRTQLSILRDNDDYFHGLAYAWRPVHNCTSNEVTEGATHDAWDGYLWIDSDAQAISYWYVAKGGSDNITTFLTLYNAAGTGYNVVQQTVGTTAETTVAANFVSLSSIFGSAPAVGLYRVLLRCSKEIGDTVTLRLRAPVCLTYTGGYSYATPPAIGDGNVSSVAQFNTWRNNDIFFNACKPRQPAFTGREYRSAAGSTDVWDGYILHMGTRLYYSVKFTKESAGQTIQIVYDYGAGNESVLNETTTGTYTGYYDLTGTYTYHTWKRVAVRLPSGGTGECYYLYVAPQVDDDPAAKAYVAMAEFAVDQYVYGNTAGQGTRLQLFSDNDRHLFEYLCESASIGRRDYAVRCGDFYRLGTIEDGDMKLVRRFDTLYYRTSGATMTWGTDQNQSLDDYDSDNYYRTMDLSSIGDLPYGTIYTISGGEVCFAMEK